MPGMPFFWSAPRRAHWPAGQDNPFSAGRTPPLLQKACPPRRARKGATDRRLLEGRLKNRRRRWCSARPTRPGPTPEEAPGDDRDPHHQGPIHTPGATAGPEKAEPSSRPAARQHKPRPESRHVHTRTYAHRSRPRSPPPCPYAAAGVFARGGGLVSTNKSGLWPLFPGGPRGRAAVARQTPRPCVYTLTRPRKKTRSRPRQAQADRSRSSKHSPPRTHE